MISAVVTIIILYWNIRNFIIKELYEINMKPIQF